MKCHLDFCHLLFELFDKKYYQNFLQKSAELDMQKLCAVLEKIFLLVAKKMNTHGT